MGFRDEPHFARQGKVEKDDSASLAVPDRIILIPVGADFTPRMGAVDLYKFFIHGFPLLYNDERENVFQGRKSLFKIHPQNIPQRPGTLNVPVRLKPLPVQCNLRWLQAFKKECSAAD